ncbi:hypothetical protein B566_EDAN008009 [Ephemera danica]|nr:hypothetical protein B566_EDAN008009 [Ephemera danica]
MFEIPKMKLFIYTLTFLGYAYSGYGSGVLTNLRDAVLAAETVFKDVLGNVVIIAQKFRDVHDIFDAAVEENCEYKCPNGGVAVRNKLHKPSSDGCGSYGISVSGFSGLPCSGSASGTSAARRFFAIMPFFFVVNFGKIVSQRIHSLSVHVFIIYCISMQTCSVGLYLCFLFVLACKAAAKMLFTGTMTLGCKSYIDSQTNACYCLPPKKGYTKYPGGP